MVEERCGRWSRREVRSIHTCWKCQTSLKDAVVPRPSGSRKPMTLSELDFHSSEAYLPPERVSTYTGSFSCLQGTQRQSIAVFVATDKPVYTYTDASVSSTDTVALLKEQFISEILSSLSQPPSFVSLILWGPSTSSSSSAWHAYLIGTMIDRHNHGTANNHNNWTATTIE